MDCSDGANDDDHDDNAGFILQKDTQMPIISAWNPQSWEMSYHAENKKELSMVIYSNGNIVVTDLHKNFPGYFWHGILMYTCWSVLSLV